MALHKKKTRSRRYPAKTLTNADYAIDIALLANTPVQAESLPYSQEKAAGDIGLYMNAKRSTGVLIEKEIALL